MALLFAKKNNELITKNHELCLIGSQTLPRANVNIYINSGHNRGGKKGCGYYHCGSHMHIRQRTTELTPPEVEHL